MAGWFRSIFEGARESRGARQDFYECLHCQRSYEEWTGDCPECGQLVVRIVEPDGEGVR